MAQSGVRRLQQVKLAKRSSRIPRPLAKRLTTTEKKASLGRRRKIGKLVRTGRKVARKALRRKR